MKKDTESKRVTLMQSPISAGFPSPATDYTEHELDFNELLISNPSTTFCLRVKGESMSDAGINTGDIVVVDRSLAPSHKDIVVANVDGEFTLKRLINEHGTVSLRAENEDFKDIELHGSMELEIFGVVVAAVKKFR